MDNAAGNTVPFPRPRVAAIVTEYRPLSHADVLITKLITKLLEGYDLFWTRVEPGVQVVSLYTDQVPPNDIGPLEWYGSFSTTDQTRSRSIPK